MERASHLEHMQHEADAPRSSATPRRPRASRAERERKAEMPGSRRRIPPRLAESRRPPCLKSARTSVAPRLSAIQRCWVNLPSRASRFHRCEIPDRRAGFARQSSRLSRSGGRRNDRRPERDPGEHQRPQPSLAQVVVGERLFPRQVGDAAAEAELEGHGERQPDQGPGPEAHRGGRPERPQSCERARSTRRTARARSRWRAGGRRRRRRGPCSRPRGAVPCGDADQGPAEPGEQPCCVVLTRQPCNEPRASRARSLAVCGRSAQRARALGAPGGGMGVERDLDLEVARGGPPRRSRRRRGRTDSRRFAAGDLRRRPPQRAARDLALAPAPGDRVPHEAVSPPVSSRPRRTGRNGSGSMSAPTSAASLGHGVGLLVARPPCLMGSGPVTGGVDAGHAADPAVGVDPDEPIAVGGHAREPEPSRERQRRRALDVDHRPPGSAIRAAPDGRIGRCRRTRSSVGEHLADRVAGRRAEDGERALPGVTR